MEFTVKINTDNLTQFECNLIKLVNTTTFNRQYLDEETGKYAASKLLESSYDKEEFIKKVCKWIRDNYDNYSHNPLGKELIQNDFLKEFKNI